MFALAATVAAFSLDNSSPRRVLDEFGRTRIFHGLNVIFKSPPYFPTTGAFDPTYSFGEDDARLLNRHGINAIRLGTMWPGAAPFPPPFSPNMTYLNLIAQTTALCQRYNITVLWDAHQDSMSELYCGEGTPSWAAAVPDANLYRFPLPLSLPYSRDPTTLWPSRADCDRHQWALYEFTFAGAAAYQNWWDSNATNPLGRREAFGEFWASLSQLRSGLPVASRNAVVGFELVNEPFAGDVFERPTLLEPWVADQQNLQPFYDGVAPGARRYDANVLVFFEPVTWSGGIVHDGSAGFTHAPGGAAFANRSVFAYHYYQPPNPGDIRAYLTARTAAAVTLGTGLMCTETDTGGRAPGADYSDIAAKFDAMDEFVQSWFGWEYKTFLPPGGTCTGCGGATFVNNGPEFDPAYAAMIARTFAPAVAGAISAHKFDSKTKYFVLSWVHSGAVARQAPTEIFADEAVQYPTGLTCSCYPVAAIACRRTAPNRYVVDVIGPVDDGSRLACEISPN